MNLETLQTVLDSLKTFKLDKPLGESEQYRIKNTLRQQVIDWSDNWDTKNVTTGSDSTEDTLNPRPKNSVNFISKDIKDYFRAGNDSLVTEILDNYSIEIQAKDFQHSNLCGCSSCCGNQIDGKNNATQEGSRFENRSSFNASDLKWSQPGGKGNPVNITYSFSNLLDGGLNGISAEQAEAAIEEALAEWSQYAPLEFTEVTDSSSVQIRIGHDYIDGQSNTLAFAYFPGNADISGDITFDSGDSWNTSLFLETAVHEIGHSLGLGHQSGGTNAIMNPTIQNRYNGLGTAFLYQDDIDGIRSIYGSGSGSVNPLGGNPPTPTPDPTPDPTPTPSGFDGTNGDDILIGNNQPNLIRGFNGNDYIEGAGGVDTIEGGGGADTFVFSSLDGSVDRIVDYSKGDRIQVSRAGFGSSNGFTYNETTGDLSFNNEQFIFLENKPSFPDVASGFVIV